MASESQSRFASAMRELLSLDLYKRSQGKRLRQLSAAGIGVFVLWGLKSLSDRLVDADASEWVAYGAPIALSLVSGWALFRLVNWPRFADFLIATEAEMTKVSWSTRAELIRATVVVLVTLFLLSGFLLSVDLAWAWILKQIGVLQLTSAGEWSSAHSGGWGAAIGEPLQDLTTGRAWISRVMC